MQKKHPTAAQKITTGTSRFGCTDHDGGIQHGVGCVVLQPLGTPARACPNGTLNPKPGSRGGRPASDGDLGEDLGEPLGGPGVALAQALQQLDQAHLQEGVGDPLHLVVVAGVVPRNVHHAGGCRGGWGNRGEAGALAEVVAEDLDDLGDLLRNSDKGRGEWCESTKEKMREVTSRKNSKWRRT